MGRSYLVLFVTALYAALAERIFLRVSSGGRGIVLILELLIPFVAGSIFLLEHSGASLRFWRSRNFRLFFLPYITLTIALPLLGCLWNDYPARTILTALPGLRAISFISFGCWLVYAGARIQRLALRILFGLICIESLLAITQYGHNHELLSGGLLDWQYRWDVYSQSQYSSRYVITGRSVGTFINPNELGFWSVVSVWLAAFLFRGWPRLTAVGAALVSLFLSQSRGSLFALVTSLMVWSVYVFWVRPRGSLYTRFLLVCGFLALLLSATLSAVFFQDRFVQSPVLSRFGSGIKVLSQGASADQNAEGRVLAWKRALIFYADHFAGTWGEPQLRFGSYMDNDYVRILLQGSPLYLGSFLVLLCAGFWGLREPLFTGRVLAMVTVSIAVNAMSANPVSYTATSFFWMVAGFHYTRQCASFPGDLVRVKGGPNWASLSTLSKNEGIA